MWRLCSVRLRVCVCVRACVCLQLYVCVRVHVCVSKYAHVYACVCMCTHTCGTKKVFNYSKYVKKTILDTQIEEDCRCALV
jgi:hypothetical protein